MITNFQINNTNIGIQVQQSNNFIMTKYTKHHNVNTISEALSILDYYQDSAKLIAGGIDVLRLIKNRVKTR